MKFERGLAKLHESSRQPLNSATNSPYVCDISLLDSLYLLIIITAVNVVIIYYFFLLLL